MRIAALLVVVALAQGCSCGTSPFTADQTARICITLEACMPGEWASGDFGGSLSACTTNPQGFFPLPVGIGGTTPLSLGMEPYMRDIYQCVLGANGDCGATTQCFGSSGEDAGTCLPESLQEGTCSVTGSLSGCSGDAFGYEIDCTLYNGTCGLQSAGATSYYACVDMMCQAGALPACRGNVAEQCSATVVYGLLDCSQEGATCATDTDAGAYCKGAACTGSEPSCDGNIAVTCLNGSQLKYDCTKGPTLHRCAQGVCVESNTACAIGAPETCSGTNVSFCQDGTTTTIDCSKLGFATCANSRCSH
jgi:hypothetical protein